jgi:diadenosine tetraphosphate (Ap4A) HIT family hydrolase
VEGCLACDLAEGRVDLPGGVILTTDRWIVEHCVGPLGVGTLIVEPKRHVVHVWDLEQTEAAELGPLLRRVTAALPNSLSPTRSTSASGRMPAQSRFISTGSSSR